MGKVERCAQCKEDGVLGPEIRIYAFAAPSGKSVFRCLHASDSARDCYWKFKDRYDEHMKTRPRKEASNG